MNLTSSQFFTGPGYQQPMGSYPAQQFQMNAYLYQGPSSYPYTMPNPNPMQPQPPVNPRAKPQFVQPSSSSPAQRPPARPLPVPPPRKKNILQIVDPDTNEEVKVSKVETRPAPKPPAPPPVTRPPVKIPPRRSHALELVSDPADDTKQPTSETRDVSLQAPQHSATTESIKEMTAVTAPSDATEKSIVEVKTKLPDESAYIGTMRTSSSTSESLQTSETETFGAEDVVKPPEPVQPLPSSSETSMKTEALASAPVSSPTSADPGHGNPDPEHSPPDSTQKTDSDKLDTKPGTVKTDDDAVTGKGSALSRLSRELRGNRIEDAPMTCPARGVRAKRDNTAHASSEVSPSSSASPDDSSRVDQKPSPELGSTPQVKESPPESPKTELSPAEQPDRQEPHEAPSAVDEEKAREVVQSPPSISTDTPGEQSISKLSADSTISANNDEDAKLLEASKTNDSTVVETTGPVANEDGRLVYVPTFMWDMKSTPNTKKQTEFEAILGSRDILKNAPPSSYRRNDPRGNRSGRGGGPLSADSRRAFPGQGRTGFQMVPPRGAAPPGMGAPGLSNFDAIDLRDARSRAPPPAPKSQSSVRDGDPRGTRQQGSRGRFDGLTRHNQGPIDPFVMHTPVEKLKRSEKGWKRNRDADDEVTAKVKTVRSLLNKLTLEKFEKIFKQIVDVGISTFDVLDGVVTEIFEKTLFEPKFSGMYAELCRRLEGALFDVLSKANFVDADGKPISFRRILINHCRDEFTRFASSEAEPSASDEPKQPEAPEQPKEESTSDETLSAEEKAAKAKQKKDGEAEMAVKAKRRMLANVKFIGELFIKDLLKQNVIHKQCIQKLLRLGIEKREEDVLEALCKLISKTGAKLSESKEANHYIDSYFNHLKALSMDPNLPARIRFMLQDLIEQRANNWKVRREEAGAKTIAEIHQDIEKEERAKQEAQAAARERRSRGGMHGRDRSHQNFTPRVAMTMASSRRSSANVSRTNSVIEKFGQRGSSTMPNSNLQSYRLTPGGTRSMGAGGSGSGSLRPGSGMLNPFAPLVDNRESGMNGTSDDFRQGKSAKPIVPKSGHPSRRAPPKPQPWPADKVKQKASYLVKEFWLVGLVNEVREILSEEIPKSNYPAFVEELIRISLDAKLDEADKTLGLIRDLAGGPLSGTDMVTGFSAALSQLADIEVDNPRASEYFGRYIGAVASTRKLPDGNRANFGLSFISRALPETEDPKRVTKLYVSVFATLEKEITSSMPDAKDRIHALKNAYASLDVDLCRLMNAWNPMRGLSALDDMLKSSNISFLVPHLKMEESLKGLLQGSAPGKDVLKLFKTCLSPDEGFLRAVIRQSLDWILMTPVDDVQDSFATVIGNPLSEAFESKFTADAEMGGLLEAQLFVTKNLDILPPKQVGSFDKPGAIAFHLLYDAEIVSRNMLLKWREDTGRSVQVPGKDKMVMQTSQFFQWLVQLQQ